MPVIVIAGTIEIDPSKKDEAAAAALEIMRETHKEEGNLAYAFSQDLEDDGLIHIFEKWESQEALDFLLEGAPIDQTGQRIVPNQVVHLLFHLAYLGEVFEDQYRTDDLAVAIANRHR